MAINWNVRTDDAKTIFAIAERAMKMGIVPRRQSLQDVSMDVTAAHLNGCPLRLAELLAADDANFGHDITGIRRFINRNTGRIDSAQFNPRFSA